MKRFKLTIAYDGTNYAGWQRQKGVSSVQQTIEEALEPIVHHAVTVNGSGRTDQGVHAHGQVAHVDLDTRMDSAAIVRALNSHLPKDIRIRSVARTRATFDARRSAHGKEYRYTVWNDAIMPPEKRLYATHIYRTLDIAAMNNAAQAFVGTHDFAPFSANPQRPVKTTVRTVYAVRITRRGKRIVFQVSGGGFLYKQVRSMVGFLLRVGTGMETPDTVAALLTHGAKRIARVPSAPAQGLTLWRVWYS